jgi:hypothetical protein
MAQVDPDKIDEAANNVLSEPLAYLRLAQDYLEKGCEGNPMLFGVVGLPIVQGRYGDTRQTHLDNIRAGVEKLQELANGLSYTAAHWAHAERANTPTGKDPGLVYNPPAGGSFVPDAFEFTSLYLVASLGVARLAVAGTLMACGGLAPAAFTSMALWALWAPDDVGLTKVQNGWVAAARAVQATIDQLDAALTPLDGAWDADDRHAFDVWRATFKTELGQTVGDLDAMATQIADLHNDLSSTQLKFLIFALITLALLVSYEVLDGTPAAPAAEALKNIQALVLGVAAVGTVYEIIELLAGGLYMAYESMCSGFPGLSANADGKGVGLKDITITWDAPYVAEYGH